MLRPLLVQGVDAFARLEGAWNELARSVAASHYTQTFEWARLAWKTRQAVTDDQLVCATVWSSERLVGVWPFRQNRLGSASRLELLGCGMNEEYGDPLIASDVDAARVCRDLLKLLRRAADLIEVPFVLQGGPIQKALAGTRPYTIAASLDSFAIERSGAENFDALLQTYTAHFRAKLKQPRKRLQKLGDLRFELVEEAAACAETVDWVVEEKRQWLLRQQKTSPWLARDETRKFFLAASTTRNEFGRVGFFRLTLDGRPIAAIIATIDRTRVEAMVGSFDPSQARFSPGMLIIEDVARWAVERGLDFDMRPLRMDYKERWANASTVRVHYRAPMTWKGALFLLPDYLSHSLRALARATFSAEQRAVLKNILKWRPALKSRDRTAAISVAAE